MILTIIKFICLAIGCGYGFSNMVKVLFMLKGGKCVINNFQNFAMVIGILGFIFIHFKLY